MNNKKIQYSNRVKYRRGTMLVEISIGLAVMGILVSGVYLSMRTFKGINYYHHAKQQCMAAGQAQLDSLLCRGEQLSEQQIKELWPKITLTIEQSAGTGQWEGLQHVCVIARCTTSMGKEVKVRQSRYFQKTITEVNPPSQKSSQSQVTMATASSMTYASTMTPASKVNFETIKQSLRCGKWASKILMTLASTITEHIL